MKISALLILALHPLFAESFLQVGTNIHRNRNRNSNINSNSNINRSPTTSISKTEAFLFRRNTDTTNENSNSKSNANSNSNSKTTSKSNSKSNKLKHATPKITTTVGLTEFLDFLAEYDERILVVEYYASWCKSCHKFGAKYKQLASTYADKVDKNGDIVQEGTVRFAQVEYGANVPLCRSFGIKKLPYIQIYKAPLGKINEFVCGPKYFEERLVKPLEEYLTMTDDEIEFRVRMEEGQALGDAVLKEVRGMALTGNTTRVD